MTELPLLQLLLGIVILLLTILLVAGSKKSNKLDKKNDGLRHLLSNNKINLSFLIEKGLSVEILSTTIASRIEFLIRSGAQVKVVLDILDELLILEKIKEVRCAPGVAHEIDLIDQVRLRIQEILIGRLDRSVLIDWVNRSSKNDSQKILGRLNDSFLTKIPDNMFVWGSTEVHSS